MIAARTAVDAGDRARALEQISAALALDQDFLAAQVLRDRILAMSQSASPASPLPLPSAKPSSSRPAGYEKFEQRAKRRRVDRRIDAARLALDQRRLKAAAAALDEVIDLDPNLPELAELTARFDELRRASAPRHRGPWIAAAAVFAMAVFAASWLQDSSSILSRQIVSAEPLPEPRMPLMTIGERLGVFGTGEGDRVDAPTPADAGVPDPPAVVTANVAGADVMPAPVAASNVSRAIALAPVAVTPNVSRAIALAPVAVTPHVSRTITPAPVPVTPMAPPPAAHIAEIGHPAAETAIVPISATVPPSFDAPDDSGLVKQALQHYRHAYDSLDAHSARAIWPAVNEEALARAFDGLESQLLTFENCEVRLRGEAASATCYGSARYVPKVGNRNPRVEPRVWNFTLHKAGDWKIDSARADR